MARLGDVQSYVIMLVSRGINDFRKIVEMLSSFSIPKSSIYTAIDELVKRGAIAKHQHGDRIVLTLTDRGRELIDKARDVLSKKLLELKLLLALLSDSIDMASAVSGMDPDRLEELRNTLKELLDAIEKELKRWKRISIE